MPERRTSFMHSADSQDMPEQFGGSGGTRTYLVGFGRRGKRRVTSGEPARAMTWKGPGMRNAIDVIRLWWLE